MTSPNIILDVENGIIRFYCTLDQNEAIQYIKADTDQTFVCVNDPSSLAANLDFSTIRTDGSGNQYYELDTSLTFLDLTKDLIFLYINTIDQTTLEAKTTLIVVYDGNSLFKYIWGEVKHMLDKNCCGDICKHSNMILYKYAFETAMSGRYVRDAINYWRRIHSANITTNSNCGCNG